MFQDIDIVLDGGAYCTLTPVVLSRAAIHATGPYACPNVRIRARAVATNTRCGFPWTGAIAADIRPIDDVRSTAADRRVVTQNVLAELLNQ